MGNNHTLEKLWHLRGNTDEPQTFNEFREEASDTAFLAISTIKKQEAELNKLKDGLYSFLHKNFKGGSKSDREDYVQRVPCKDIYELKLLIERDAENG